MSETIEVINEFGGVETIEIPAEFEIVEVQAEGPQGPAGPSGTAALSRYYGEGEPGFIEGASPGDEYVDTLTGIMYVLQ